MPESPAYRAVLATAGALLSIALGVGLVTARPPPPGAQFPVNGAAPPGGTTATPTCGPPEFTPWTVVQSVPVGGRLMSLASDSTYVYATGGYSSPNQLARYAPAVNTWMVLSSLPVAAEGPTAVYAPNTARLYVFGGPAAIPC